MGCVACVNSSLNRLLLTAGDAGNYTQLHPKARNQAEKERKGVDMGQGKKPNWATTLSLSTLGMVVLLLAASTGQVFGQAVNAGEIRGTVTDPSGAVVPGVNVTILNTETGVRTDLVTNE